MDQSDVTKLLSDLDGAFLQGARRVAILGLTPTTLAVIQHLRTRRYAVEATIFAEVPPDLPLFSDDFTIRSYDRLVDARYDVVVVAHDREKERELERALPYLQGVPIVLVAGYGHYAFSDELFEGELAQLLAPSLANGYPNTLVHIYQCLVNAARLGLEGGLVELGTFKGGTSMFMARIASALGQAWDVTTFDTWEGFPPRRSPLDMYAHPGAVFRATEEVERYFAGWPITIVRGDLRDTVSVLAGRPLVLSFFDTDNYSAARIALGLIADTTLVGGAIVFDHFTGVDRFRYTLGERMAAKLLLQDPRYFNLHDTGVFFRQQ